VRGIRKGVPAVASDVRVQSKSNLGSFARLGKGERERGKTDEEGIKRLYFVGSFSSDDGTDES
jgi:hypothetical protein